MTEGTGNDNTNHDQPGDNAPDEAATPSGWVVTKEAPQPAEEPAPTNPSARTKVKKPAPRPQARKPAPKAKTPAAKATKRPATRRAAAGKKTSAKKTSGKKTSGKKTSGKKTSGASGKKKAARPARTKKKTARRR
jgi:valyl-tRNA synthetase